ncbi:MAG TPA: 6,7-dimethyl-8-ribityllumazine synthase [Candidatus Limnocylindrales bacterium]|nr:6,7-dimethyl-8-ribityllumazine synthase [Candidatus Limnocylindrales bacterium]
MTESIRIAIVVSRFNRSVTDNLLEGARAAAAKLGVSCDEADVFAVPGAFELPLVAREAAMRERYAGVVCLGAVIRGETPHFDYVCSEAAAGIARVSMETGKPVAFGVLTTDDVGQALERAGGAVGNKGYEAVVTVVETLEAIERVRAAGSGA